MKRTLLASTLTCLGLLSVTTGAGAADRPPVNHRTGLYEPPLADLRKAAERGDRAELARAAGRLGPARLGKALAESDRRIILAALEGIPLVPAGVLLFEQIAPLAAATDAPLRERALRTLAALLAGTDPARLAEWDVPAESTRTACQALAGAANNDNELPPLRLLAVQGLADAGATCAPSFVPAKLLSARDPELRRAAVLALPPSADAKPALLAALKDSDPRVAAAAGARLCTLHKKSETPLPPLGLARLALAGSAAVEDVLEMLPCLTSSKDPEDVKALETLRESGPAAVRDALKKPAAPSKNP